MEQDIALCVTGAVIMEIVINVLVFITFTVSLVIGSNITVIYYLPSY